MENKPTSKRELLLPILLGGLSILGIGVVFLFGSSINSPAPVPVNYTDTPFRYIYLGTEPGLSPLELLAYLPGVGSWIERVAPHDSHAGMHLDSAARGPKFEYAFQAAVKQTRWEFDQQARRLPGALLGRFCDLAAGLDAPLARG